MATATYRIGPSDFFTGGDLAADADTLDQQASDLDAQVEGNEQVDQNLHDQWGAWLTSWRSFKSDHFGGFFSNLLSALNDGNRDQLIQFEKTFANFAQQFQSTAQVNLAGGIIQASSGSGDTIGAQLNQQLGGDTSGLATKVIVVMVLVVVAIFFWKK